jgi:hypothetical protein
MKHQHLPVTVCHANCPGCHLPIEFKMFESGCGGDFSTYLGDRTGAIYRVDLGQVHYQGRTIDELLLPALQQEQSMTRVPEEIRCKLCGSQLGAAHILADREETIDAYEL